MLPRARSGTVFIIRKNTNEKCMHKAINEKTTECVHILIFGSCIHIFFNIIVHAVCTWYIIYRATF